MSKMNSPRQFGLVLPQPQSWEAKSQIVNYKQTEDFVTLGLSTFVFYLFNSSFYFKKRPSQNALTDLII